MRVSVALFILALFDVVNSNEEGEEEIHFTNSWAVHIDNEDLDAVNGIALKHGFVNQGQVKWVEQQRILERSKRDLIPGEDELVQRSVARLRRDTAVSIRDPFFKDQWYLLKSEASRDNLNKNNRIFKWRPFWKKAYSVPVQLKTGTDPRMYLFLEQQNIGQSSGPRDVDINVLPVWARGLSGTGIVVSVLDDGVDHTHPDLKPNFDADASFDFNDFDSDPKPRDENSENCHGTKCAGEVAARANNGICGVGVSFNASIGGIRMLDGKATDTIEGSSLSYRSEYIDIYSCCWGPKDDGKRFGKPGYLASKALQIGAERGRGGLGNIFVWATGNGGLTDDDCNCDGYTTSIYTISIGAISDHGLSTYYTETCASTLAVTFSGGSHRESIENKVITTDLHHKCTRVFKGTSSAAPLAAGMMALLLESNPRLTWRDVQHIIVETSQMTSLLDEGWKINGAGKRFNRKFGFGRLDASLMVEKALKWKNVDKQKTCPGAVHNTTRFLPDSGSLILSANTSACASTAAEIRKLEHVQLKVSLQHRHRGDLSVSVISPSGTRSDLLTTRRNDHSASGLKDWIFMTVHFWGEDPRGLWTVIFEDNNSNNREHYAQKLKQGDAEDVTRVFMDDTEKHRPTESAAKDEELMGLHYGLEDNNVLKTMEDTASKLFKGNAFSNPVQKKKTYHDKSNFFVAKIKTAVKTQQKSHANNGINTGNNKKQTLFRKDHKKSDKEEHKKPVFKAKNVSKFRKQGGKRSGKNNGHKHPDSNNMKHERKAIKEPVTAKDIGPRKNTNQKHDKSKYSKKGMKSKLAVSKPKTSVSNVSLAQAQKTGQNTPSSPVVNSSSIPNNTTATLALITRLLSEIQKNPLVRKIALEALRDPAIGEMFGLSGKARDSSPGSMPKGKTSNLANYLATNVSLPIPNLLVEGTNKIEGKGNNDSKARNTTKGTLVEVDSNVNQDQKSQNKADTSSEGEAINRIWAVSGSGHEKSGNYGVSGLGNSGDIGSAGNASVENVQNFVEKGCAERAGRCRETQADAVTVIIQSNSSRFNSKELDGEDNFFEVTGQDDKEGGLYEDGEGDDFYENVKKDAYSDDGAIELLPAFDRSEIEAPNNNNNGDNTVLCDLTAEPGNRTAMLETPCRENATSKRNTEEEKVYETEQLASNLAVGKLREGGSRGSTEEDDSDNQAPKDYSEQYYSDRIDDATETRGEMAAKYGNKDLDVLQGALEEQLSRLSKDPASRRSNAEILGRVRDDIRHGDIDDLELLEAQITGGKGTVPRVTRSTAPEDEDFDDLDDKMGAVPEDFEQVDQEGDELERRRVKNRTGKDQITQTYYVDREKYGKDNSGILESWTLILYGTK